MQIIDLPPYAPTLMESTRAIGYSIEAAVADIIDNSLTAKARRIDIDFFPVGDAYISLLDDGIGMTSDILTNAMQYGSKSPLEQRSTDDLGRYGLGLKTASLSQCRKLTVISKANNEVSGRCWDLDYIANTGRWSLIVLDSQEMSGIPNLEKLISKKNGTLVVWQLLDKFGVGENDLTATFNKKIEIVREHIALVFHRYLSGEPGLKKIEVRMNNRLVEPKDPFLSKKSMQLMDDESIVVRGERVIVKPFILPHLSKLTKIELDELGGKEGLRKNQGFYVYRNKRLLVWGNWFRLMRQGDLSKLARVQVDIPNSLDDLWTLDIKKSSANPPEDVRKNLAHTINRIAEGSKRTWTYRSKKEVGEENIHIWNVTKTRSGERIYEINQEYPLIADIIHRYPEAKHDIEILISLIQGNLPLNSLYIDLTNDEKIVNDYDKSEKEIVALFAQIIENCNSAETRKNLCSALIESDPFCNHDQAINAAINKGDIVI